MRFLVFKRRLFAAIIDGIIIFMISFTVCALIMTSIFKNTFDQQMAPFVVIILLFNPLSLIVQVLSTPQAYGNVHVVYTLFVISFVIEVMYYSLFELLPAERTPGYTLLGIRLCYSPAKSIKKRIIVRNIIKVLSRYLYCVPFIISIFNVNGNTIYDLVSKIHIETDNISRD